MKTTPIQSPEVLVTNTFIYENQLHTRIIPAKRLFNSTMVHEVVNRGDFFALNLDTNIFTILPNGADHVVQQKPQSKRNVSSGGTKSVRVRKQSGITPDLFASII